ncbi:hypothetical protein V6N11_021046 [Hibiscus sabdariffa]|uniref:Uncharacterized protein n=1 Tax=Hibiscus sabdariffa TaxID=183260 RepID=A0ABR2AAM8_9ROSI
MTQRMGKVGRASGLACSNRVMAWVSACSLGMVTEAAATPATDHVGHRRGGDSGEPSSPKCSTQSPLPLHQAVDEGSMVVYGRRELGNGAVEMVQTCGSKGWFDMDGGSGSWCCYKWRWRLGDGSRWRWRWWRGVEALGFGR